MNLQEIRAIAKQRQINSSGPSKTELIHDIQRQEGNFDCFHGLRRCVRPAGMLVT